MAGKGLLTNLTSLRLRPHQLKRICFRTFLSDGYKCEAEWKERLNSPLLLKLKNENLYAELFKKFQSEGKATAIDVDLFSNLVINENQLYELEDITNKFRRCPNTIHTLPSTPHAIIRSYLELKNTDTLMRMINDRLGYGLFLDYYLSNLLMDTFLKEENYRDAAKVASQLMIQEEFDHPIASQLALYSCYAYLKKPQPEPWDPQPKPEPVEPVEVVKVRVEYLREPFFDDHFDLVKPEHLIGKTLVGFGKHFARKQSADGVAHSSLLLGWTLFEKYDKVLQCLDTILASKSKPILYKECLERCQKAVGEASQLPEKFAEDFGSRVERLAAEGFIIDGDIQQVIKDRIKIAVEAQEKDDIQSQLQRYKDWEKQRDEEVQKQIRAMEHRKRLAILEAKKKELQEKEERLTFFDKLDEWEVKHEENEIKRQELTKFLESRSQKVSAKAQRLAEEESYFPPEIVKGKSKQ